VVSCTEDGVVGEDGVERKVDTIVCATGFDVSYRPRFPIVGKDGVDLADKWKVCPEAYLGVCIPDMPNLVTFIGPSWPVESESMPQVFGATSFNIDSKLTPSQTAASWALCTQSPNMPSNGSRKCKTKTCAVGSQDKTSQTNSTNTSR
jgi:cation diffusion facilitator CzcD-associated flavoprotein CzcO